ncbi:MAG: hypothetical protein MGG37_00450 [Trichodesmium sp. MAG_R01]|nr:hypothetical protein [Trichodesmium sp. MAG_R01]
MSGTRVPEKKTCQYFTIYPVRHLIAHLLYIIVVDGEMGEINLDTKFSTKGFKNP